MLTVRQPASMSAQVCVSMIRRQVWMLLRASAGRLYMIDMISRRQRVSAYTYMHMAGCRSGVPRDWSRDMLLRKLAETEDHRRPSVLHGQAVRGFHKKRSAGPPLFHSSTIADRPADLQKFCPASSVDGIMTQIIYVCIV